MNTSTSTGRSYGCRMILVILVLLLLSWSGYAQQPAAPPPSYSVNGTMNIVFNSRVQAGKPDIYTLSNSVANSVVFRGQLTNLPPIIDEGFGFGEPTVKRGSSLSFALDLDVITSRGEVIQSVGKMQGIAPIKVNGLYDWNNSSAKLFVYARGNSPEYNSRFSGLSQGRALYKKKSKVAEAQQTLMKLTGQNRGKATALIVTNYDFMTFQAYRIVGGPVGIYPETTVDGKMVYDRDRGLWNFNNVTVTYPGDGVQRIDRLSGNIRWVEQPKRGNTRAGEYVVDVRVNEPPATEASLQGSTSDEDAFVAGDPTVPCLTGTWRYNDTFGNGSAPVQSAIAIGMKSSKLTKQQVMYLSKLLMFGVTVPFNSE